MSPTKRKHKTALEIELRPDGWARFEVAVGVAVKSGPKHKMALKADRPPRAKQKKALKSGPRHRRP